MPRPNRTARTLHTLVIAGAFAGAALAAAVTAANAMQIFNCTNQTIPVTVIHTPTGQDFGSARVEPGQGMAWSTGNDAGYRVDLRDTRAVKHYSNRRGNEVLSIANIGGQQELLNGYQCQIGTQSARSRSQNAAPSKSDAVKGAVAAIALGILLHNVTK